MDFGVAPGAGVRVLFVTQTAERVQAWQRANNQSTLADSDVLLRAGRPIWRPKTEHALIKNN